MRVSQVRVMKAIKHVLKALAAEGAVGKAISEKVSRELFGGDKPKRGA